MCLSVVSSSGTTGAGLALREEGVDLKLTLSRKYAGSEFRLIVTGITDGLDCLETLDPGDIGGTIGGGGTKGAPRAARAATMLLLLLLLLIGLLIGSTIGGGRYCAAGVGASNGLVRGSTIGRGAAADADVDGWGNSQGA
eukprot:6077685-Pyramimonas_sp.AAC.1